MVPLTTYEDYADILLQKRTDTLPGNPVIWIQTTWEGGRHPIKLAPYTRSMLDVYKKQRYRLPDPVHQPGKRKIRHLRYRQIPVRTCASALCHRTVSSRPE